MASSKVNADSKYALELDGASMGFVKSVDGGGVYAEVITITLGSDLLPRKHLGPGQFEDFSVQIGLSMADPMYDWIAKSWTGNPERKSGSFIATDNKSRSLSQRDFSDALITETTIPALDAASKEPAWLTLKLAPESIRFRKSSGTAVGTGKKEKPFQASNFRLEIPGLDCKRVSRIDSFTVKRNLVVGAPGGPGSFRSTPGKLELPNLRVSLSEAGAQDWIDWADDFIVKGNNSPADEKNGTLVLLSANLKTELALISFFNLGICRLSPSTSDANAVRRLTAELYCERMELSVG